MNDEHLNRVVRQSLGDPPPPPDRLRRNILAAVAGDARRQRGIPRVTWARRSLVAAAAAAVVVIAVQRTRTHGPRNTDLSAADEAFILGADDFDDRSEEDLYDLTTYASNELPATPRSPVH